MIEQVAPGVFVVRYHAPEDLDPKNQGPVVARLEEASATGPTAVVFVVYPAIHEVDMRVPMFWLDATKGNRLRLAALAVVSQSAGVRLAAAGFGASNVVRGARFRVRGFDAEREAIAWAVKATDGLRPRRIVTVT